MVIPYASLSSTVSSSSSIPTYCDFYCRSEQSPKTEIRNMGTALKSSMAGFMFGPWNCRWSEVFYLSKHSLAMVNLKPIVPGHCLVISRRVVPRFTDLSAEEVSDLWNIAHTLATPLETFFKGQALTLAIQDGPVAGQTVPHVHIHILPRNPGDFKQNNDVYDELDKSDLGRDHVTVDAPDDRKPRTNQEMADEAALLRQLFSTSLPIPADDQS